MLVDQTKNGSPNVATVTYTKRTGTSSTDSLSLGVNVNIGTEIGAGFASASMSMGFEVDSTFSHTISEEVEKSSTQELDPGESLYVYHMAFQWAVVKGLCSEISGWSLGKVLSRVEEFFTDNSNSTLLLGKPITADQVIV